MYVKNTIRYMLVIAGLFVLKLFAQSNQISDGTFSTQISFGQSTTPWKVNTWNGGSGAVSGGGLLYTLTKAGSNFWDNKVYQSGVSLEQGQRYVLSFKARGIEGSRSILFGFYDTQDNTVGYGGDTVGTIITTTTQTYTFAFTMMKSTDYDVTFAFECGLSSVDLWFDDVSLVKVTDNRIPEIIPVASPTIERRPVLSWHPALEAVSNYTIQISTSPNFDSLIVNQKVTDTTYNLLADLPIGTIYWRVQGDDSYWSSNNFIIKDARIPTPVQYENPTYERQPLLQWSKPPVTVSSYTIEISTDAAFGSGSILLINSVTDTFYSVSGSDLPLGEIYWRVKADDSQYSDVSSFVVLDNKIPVLIQYESPTYNRRPTLSWHPSLGTVSSYQIQIATDQSFTNPEVLLTVSDTFYTCLTDLPIGIVYWRVKGDDSEYSSLQTIWIKDSRIPKIIPVNPKLTENRRQPVLWNMVDGANSYTIQLSDNSAFSSFLASLSLSDTMFTPTADLPAGLVYCRVKSDLVDQWSDVEYFTVLSDTLPILFRYNGNSVASRRPQFRWKSVSGATSYKIMYADNSGFTNASVIPVSDTLYSPAIDLADGSWFWKVSSSRDLNAYSPVDEVVIDMNVVVPVITSQPQSVIKTEGENAAFSIEVQGGESFVYSWYKNGNLLTGSNSNSLLINNLTFNDSGSTIFCIVSNANGADTSDVAVLSVQKATPIFTQSLNTKTVSINVVGMGKIFSGNTKDIRKISVIDMKGRTLYSINGLEESMTIGGSGKRACLANGMYLLSVKLRTGWFKKTFILTK